MGELFGKTKTLSRDGVGQVVNGFTPNPVLTNGVAPITIGVAESFAVNVNDWTVIRFRPTQNVMVTLYDDQDNVSMSFPETGNLATTYILTYVNNIEFTNIGEIDCVIYYQAF